MRIAVYDSVNDRRDEMPYSFFFVMFRYSAAVVCVYVATSCRWTEWLVEMSDIASNLYALNEISDVLQIIKSWRLHIRNCTVNVFAQKMTGF